MDFKAQCDADMAVFHNAAEFATVTGFYYDREWKEAPAVLDHEAAVERQRKSGDNAPGVSEIADLVYVAHKDLGFIPERNHEFAVKVAGVMQEYNIEKVDYEDGEIIMELGAYVE